MARFFLEPSAWGASPMLSGEEAVHCARVLRAKPGDRIEVFDGEGRSAEASIESVSKHSVTLSLGEIHREAEPPVLTVLAQAVIKGKGMEWIIQKAVELGVDVIQPLTTRNAVVKPGDDKPDKWRRTALEACKQCGRNRVPRIEDLRAFHDFIGENRAGLKWIAALESDTIPVFAASESGEIPETVTVLIGPEGDFAPFEVEQARDAGWVPVSLGNSVLRSETAAIYAMSILRYRYL